MFSGPVKIVQPFPRNVFELQGNSASVTCVAEGRPDKVQFVRRNLAGIFEKLTNTSRVYTIIKAGGGKNKNIGIMQLLDYCQWQHCTQAHFTDVVMT